MENDNLLQKKAIVNQKVSTSTGKGHRELRNLISPVIMMGGRLGVW